MRLLSMPRSIRGKLVLTFFAAIVPICFFEIIENVTIMNSPDPVLLKLKSDFGGAAAVLFGLLVIFILGNRITRPIKRLKLAATALTVGDYRKRVELKTGDEFESLAQSFNALGESLESQQELVKQQSELFSSFLEATRLVSSSIDMKECAKNVARLVCTHIGATGAAVLRKDPVDGGLKTAASNGKRPPATWKLLANHVTDSGEYLVLAENYVTNPNSDMETRNFLVGVPLKNGNNVIGAIIARFTGFDRESLCYGSTRADALMSFSIYAATAISNAEIHSQTERYSEVLEDWVEHLSSIMQVTNAISPSLNLDETLAALSKATASVLNADECVIYLPDRNGNLIARHCCHPDKWPMLNVIIKPGTGETGRAFHQKKYATCRDASQSEDSRTRLMYQQFGFYAVISTPLIVDDQAIGAITAYYLQPRKFSAAEVRLFTSIGLHAAVIVRNAKLYTHESAIAEALQHGLISQAPSECRGLRFCTRYLPASNEARIGGDFYDVSVLPDGNIGVVMADVSGKGLRAAIHLATCKYMMKSLAYAHPNDPAQVLKQLNEATNYFFDLSFYVTMFYGIIDPIAMTIKYANAGHPPGLLITVGGKLHSSLSGTGTPIGAGYSCDYETCTVSFNQSDLLILYTDGITDALLNGEPLGVEGLHKLVFDKHNSSMEEIVDHLCNRLIAIPGSRQRDDMTLLAVSFNGTGELERSLVGGSGGQFDCIRIATA